MHRTRTIALFSMALAVVFMLTPTKQALAQGGPEVMVLDLEADPGKAPIPPNCSNWHELYPTYCSMWHQGEYADNGDGQISACDKLLLSGLWYHIEWVGPTYFLTCNGEQAVYEPTTPNPTGGNPTCETWREIFPVYGALHHVDEWEDSNQDGMLSECDIIFIAGRACHLDRIGLDISVRYTTPPVLDGSSSWGTLKTRYDE